MNNKEQDIQERCLERQRNIIENRQTKINQIMFEEQLIEHSEKDTNREIERKTNRDGV